MAVNIKALRQERADLENEIGEQKKLGRQLLSATGDDGVLSEGQNEQYEALDTALRANESRLDAVVRTIAQYERLQDLQRDMDAAKSINLNDDEPPQAVKTPKLFSTFGEQMAAIMAVRTGNLSMVPEKHVGWLKQIEAVGLGMGEHSGAAGGFLVQQDFSNEIFRVMFESGQILSRVRRQPVSGNGLKLNTVDETSRATGSRWGGVQGYWIGEGVAPTASRPNFSQIEWTLKKLGAVGYATDEFLQDVIAQGQIMQQAFAEELTWLAENAIVRGSGAGEPMGVLNAAATVSVSAEGGQAASTILAENIINMWARMHARSRPNAVWYINQDIEPQLHTMSIAVGTGGSLVYMPAGGLSGAPFGSLFGRPVIPVEYCSTLGTVGDIILADLSQYMLIDKGGLRQDSSMHVQFLTDQETFRAIYRIDGKPLWKSALTPANGSNTQSPFITLATRS